MKILYASLLALILVFATSVQAAPPTQQSVEKLLELSQAGKLMDSAFSQMDNLTKASMKQVMKGQPVSAADQAILDKQQTKILAIVKEELSWDKLKPDFIQVYQQTYTQEEVDGLIAFYQSPAGQAFVAKQPELMKNTMTVMQGRMGPMMEKIQKMSTETAHEIQAAHSDK